MSRVPRISRAILNEEITDERLIRWVEALAQEIDDSRPLRGSGNPNGQVQANASRLYIDADTGDLWLNNSPLERQSGDWINKG